MTRAMSVSANWSKLKMKLLILPAKKGGNQIRLDRDVWTGRCLKLDDQAVF